MNKNGFTLLEVLAVIVLISAIGVTFGIGAKKLNENRLKKQYKHYEEEIIEASKSYVNTNNLRSDCVDQENCILYIDVSSLISDGLIDEDKNTIAEELINNNEKIKVEWQSGERSISFDN